MEHRGQGVLRVDRRAVGQTGDDCAAGEQVRIGGQHRRRHRAAGRQPGDVDALLVQPVVDHHVGDHAADRGDLALAARGVARLEPVEAAMRIVRAALLRQQQGEPMPLGQGRPPGPGVIRSGGLRAPVQHHHERRTRWQSRRHIAQHPQRARIRAKRRHFLQPAVVASRRAARWLRAPSAAARQPIRAAAATDRSSSFHGILIGAATDGAVQHSTQPLIRTVRVIGHRGLIGK